MSLEQLLQDARNVGRANGNGRQQLEQRVSQLEQIVNSLAQQPPAGDQISPNYLTVSPSGAIGADFSGVISASELDLIGGPGASPIKWKTAAGGLLAELTVDASGDLILSPAGSLEAQAASFAGLVTAGGGLYLNENNQSDPLNPSSGVAWHGPGPAFALGAWLQGYFDGNGEAHLGIAAGVNHSLDLLHVNSGGVDLSDYFLAKQIHQWASGTTGTLGIAHTAIPASGQIVTAGNTGLIICIASVLADPNSGNFVQVSVTIDGAESGPQPQSTVVVNMAAVTVLSAAAGATHTIGMNAWAGSAGGLAGPLSGVILTP